MTKTIYTKEIELELACIAIQKMQQKKRSATSLVLAEIIKASVKSQFLFAKELSKTIPDILNITPVHYRRSIHLLYKLGLIAKIGHIIVLANLTKACSQISIKSAELETDANTSTDKV